MKTKEIETLESYFKTENEHWNEYSLETIKKAYEIELFGDLTVLMRLYESSITIATQTHKEKPFEGLQFIIENFDKNKLSTKQKVYLLERIFDYLNNTEFGDLHPDEIQDLIKSQIIKFNNEIENSKPPFNKPLTGNIRDALKELMKKELEQLPEILKELDPLQRLNVLCKLIPYVLPKTESVKHNFGEPDEYKIKRWHD